MHIISSLMSHTPSLNGGHHDQVESLAVYKDISNTAMGILKGCAAWVGGCAATPINVMIHEWGHALTARALIKDCIPTMNYLGTAFLSSRVTFEHCSEPQEYVQSMILIGGPFVEITAVSALLYLSKSKYMTVALLPHVYHIASQALLPLFSAPDNQDYSQLLSISGSAVYSIAAMAAMIPVGLAIRSLVSKRSS